MIVGGVASVKKAKTEKVDLLIQWKTEGVADKKI